METKKTLAEELTESTQPMLDETAPKFEHKQEDCDRWKKKRKTLNEVKPSKT